MSPNRPSHVYKERNLNRNICFILLFFLVEPLNIPIDIKFYVSFQR